MSYPTAAGWIRQERPPTRETFPTFNGTLPAGAPRVRLALDVTQLARVAKALGSPLLLLDVYAPDRPMMVHPLSHTTRDGFALVMPFRLETLDLPAVGDAPDTAPDGHAAAPLGASSGVPSAVPVALAASPDTSPNYS